MSGISKMLFSIMLALTIGCWAETADVIGLPVNGVCPNGYTKTEMCAKTQPSNCPSGLNNIGPVVQGLCPPGATAYDGVCCSSLLYGTCATPSMALGPCTSACGLGYACSADVFNSQCCPVVDYTNPQNILGPSMGGMCPLGYVVVYTTPEGECVSLDSVPGVCSPDKQVGLCPSSVCPAGFTCNQYAGVCCP